jgi:SCP-2 sterol transfer family protein
MAHYLSPEWVRSFDAALTTLDLSDAIAAAGAGSLAAADGTFSVVQVVTGVPGGVAEGVVGGDEIGGDEVRGDEVRVVLTVAEGRARLALDPAGDHTGTATIVLGYPDALAMARGELDPADALAAGRVRVRGDLAALVAGQDVLAAAATRLGSRLDGLTDTDRDGDGGRAVPAPPSDPPDPPDPADPADPSHPSPGA